MKIMEHIEMIFSFRYSYQVAIGDKVLVQANDFLTPEKVINVSSFAMEGKH